MIEEDPSISVSEQVELDPAPQGPTDGDAAGIGSDAAVVDPAATSNGGKVLEFGGTDDFIDFEPVHLDLSRGWTVSAELRWEVDSAERVSIGFVCVHDLATLHDEDRLVCVIDPTGLPQVFVRWDSRLATPVDEGDYVSIRRIIPGELYRVTWAVDPSGLATTFIDGEVVWQFQLDWHAAARVFQTHRLGAPGMVHASNQIRHFTLDDPRDSAVSFTAFRGTLSRIAAWNTALGRISDGWDHLPGPDLTWSRTLLTVDSRRRYLHAGRLDASEPPVALFPMDLDGGLTIQSSLGQQHAELTLAHARLAEAYRQAADLKEAALQAAQDKVDRATADLVTAQAKADAAIGAAEQKATAARATAEQTRASGDAQAAIRRAAGASRRDQVRADGQLQANAHRIAAQNDHDRRIDEARRRPR